MANTAGSIEGAGDFLLGANQLTVGSNNLSTNVSGTINDGGRFGGTGASLVKVGTGTLTLSGANTYTGGTTINGGTLSISADNNLGDAAGPLALNGGTLQITAAGVTLSPTRAVSLGAGGGTFDVTQSANISSGVSGAGGLTKTGAGTLALGGANTYSGGTTVNAGTLQLLPGASLGAGGALTVNGGTFNTGGNNLSVGVLSRQRRRHRHARRRADGRQRQQHDAGRDAHRHGQPGQARQRIAEPHRRQHLYRADLGECRRPGGERQSGQHGHPG